MNIALAAANRRAAAADSAIRVMVVDDAVVARSLVTRWVDAEPDMTIVASLRTGREAVEQIDKSNPDVVVLDVEMPELDGISALPLLLKKKHDLVVIMASAVTRRGAEVSCARCHWVPPTTFLSPRLAARPRHLRNIGAS
jgi:two-component system chemotaxis response regulator CheB